MWKILDVRSKKIEFPDNDGHDDVFAETRAQRDDHVGPVEYQSGGPRDQF